MLTKTSLTVNIIFYIVHFIGKGVGSLVTGELYTIIGIRWTFRVYGAMCIVLLVVYIAFNRFVFHGKANKAGDNIYQDTAMEGK